MMEVIYLTTNVKQTGPVYQILNFLTGLNRIIRRSLGTDLS